MPSSLPPTPLDTPTPGDFLLHPFPLLALLLIMWNDAYLKRVSPGFWSGKLSDLGLCFLLPLVLTSLVEWGGWLWSRLRLRRWVPSEPPLFTSACLVTILYFSALQLSERWASWHIWWVQKLLPQIRAGVTLDVTDLFALVMVPIAWRYLLAWRSWPPSSSLTSDRQG